MEGEREGEGGMGRRGDASTFALPRTRTRARKKGWSDCSHQPWLLNQASRSTLQFRAPASGEDGVCVCGVVGGGVGIQM